MKKLTALIMAAILVFSLAACSRTVPQEEVIALRDQIKESTEHSMILNGFVAYMFGIKEDSDEQGLITDGENYNMTVNLLRLNNYLEYEDHITKVKEERDKIIEKMEEWKGKDIPKDLQKMYDEYIIVSDIAIEPANEEDSLKQFAAEYKDALEKSEKIYDMVENWK
ncbi:MAG: hypothetical protein KBS51_00950 [Lachnospiraceae bacterium]|nr:hypothetical protein [Candidatus Darwinimomas equi]